MGRKKIEKTEVKEKINEEINSPKTDEIVSEDINTPIEQESDVNQPKESTENEDIKEEKDLITTEEKISEAIEEEESEDIKDEPTELSNFIFLLEEIINSNQDVDFDILNLKNQIRKLIAEFK